MNHQSKLLMNQSLFYANNISQTVLHTCFVDKLIHSIYHLIMLAIVFFFLFNSVTEDTDVFIYCIS